MPLGGDNLFSGVDPSALGEEIGGADGSGSDPASEETIRRLTQVTEEQVKARVMGELMKDPEIFSILRARQSGKRVKIVEEGAEPPASSAPQQSDGLDGIDETTLEGMSKKEMVGLVLKSVTKQLDNFFKQQSQPIVDRLGQLENTASSFAQERTQQAVQQVAQKYPDFWDFKDPMIQLSQKHPTMDAEELYLMAKVRAGKFVPKTSRTSTERPTNMSTRPPKVQQKNHTEQAIRELANQSLKGFFEANREGIDLDPREIGFSTQF